MRISILIGVLLLALSGCQGVKTSAPEPADLADEKVYSYQLGNGRKSVV